MTPGARYRNADNSISGILTVKSIDSDGWCELIIEGESGRIYVHTKRLTNPKHFVKIEE